MSKTAGAYDRLAQRLAETLILFHQQGQVTRSQLADKFAVSERTIFRDLSRLSPIIEHQGGEYYHLAPQYYLSLRTRDIQQLLDIAGASSVFAGQNAVFWSTLLHTEGLPQFTVKPLAAEHQVESALSRSFGLLQQAITGQQCCTFVYKGKARRVEPYRLVNVKNLWYLAAMEQDNLKGFLLSGIRWLVVSKETFTPQMHIHQCIDEEDDVWFSLHKFPVRLHVSALVAGYFLRRSVLPGQAIETHHPDGSLDVTCRIADERQLLPIVRYWLPELRIISPESLHSVLVKQLEAALSAIKQNSLTMADDIKGDDHAERI
ncbi:TPA: helix-turn-helix transcriptional regulator [Citrobacter braakii]